MSLKITLELTCLSCVTLEFWHTETVIIHGLSKARKGLRLQPVTQPPLLPWPPRYQWDTGLLAQGLPKHLLGVGRDLSTIWLLVGVRA